MGSLLKRPRFTTYLPTVPCTAEQRESILRIAETEGVSVAEVLRAAANQFMKDYAATTNTAAASQDQPSA